MMTFPIYGKVKNVPNHQPVLSISRFPTFSILFWLCFKYMLVSRICITSWKVKKKPWFQSPTSYLVETFFFVSPISPSVVLESWTRILHHREAFVHREAMLLDGSQTAARLTLHQLQHVGHLAGQDRRKINAVESVVTGWYTSYVCIILCMCMHIFDTCTQKLHAAAGNVNSPASLLACKIRSYRASVICTQHGQTSVTKGLRNLHSIVNGAATKCLVESLSQRSVQCWGVLF